MLKKVIIAGAAAAVVLGAGTAALAMSGSSASPSASTSKAAGRAAKMDRGGPLKRALHATWVSRDGNSGFTTHDAIRGQVIAVSATSITVQAADSFSQTYAVDSSTTVHTRAAGKGRGKAGTISDVKSGDRVVVMGTGTSSLTATRVLDGAK